MRIHSLSIKPLFAFLFSLFILVPISFSNTKIILSGKEIPDRYETGARFIFSESDSLYLNNKLLQRGDDYKFVNGEGFFDLSHIPKSETDTLIIRYELVPSWVPATLGRKLPDATEVKSSDMSKDKPKLKTLSQYKKGNLSLNGTKTFRFSTKTNSGSEFGQTLDLSISGELSPGLELTGSVSDRGFDPSYGTANSRLNELDRLKLMLHSRNFTAQIGDLLLQSDKGEVPVKTVSGLAVELDFPAWFFKTVTSRPRGQFATLRFMGQDRFQGPYQLTSDGRAGPVVPGSERVWLDSRELMRGAEKDYTVDYPSGRITFSVDNPIDSRSRIEVDFEPQATEYKQEMRAASGGATINDSLLSFSLSVLREGDDASQPLRGELSQAERDILALAGDSAAFKSGMVLDSLGDYQIDSTFLPDTVYVWIGDKQGDRRVNFSFTGEGKGDYNFIGGDEYRYIGQKLGDYLPLLLLPTATRANQYKGMLVSNIPSAGRFSFDLRATDYDQNLFSNVDDGDNDALFYRFKWNRDWGPASGSSQLKIIHQLTEQNYRSRDRLTNADFDRHYYLPAGYKRASDELLSEYFGKLRPFHWLQISPFFGRLRYKKDFTSDRAVVVGEMKPSERSGLTMDWHSIRSGLTDTVLERNGRVKNIGLAAYYIIGNQDDGYRLSIDYENDNRTNDYDGSKRGTRYDEYELSVLHGDSSSAYDKIQYQTRREDSLYMLWGEIVKRDRLIAVSNRQMGNLAYDASLTYQWLKTISDEDNSLLGRLSLRYSNFKNGIQARTSYTISEERRNARGISFLEVENGLGDFIFEDSQYIPDTKGNFIKVEEILSNAQEVRRANKSFYLSKHWQVMNINFSSDIEEELKTTGKRNSAWILPFYSDHTQPYLFYQRRYRGDMRFLPFRGFHVINISGSEEYEIREITSVPRTRYAVNGEVTLKQAINESFLEERLSLFRINRDRYFSGSGRIKGFESSLKVRQGIGSGEISFSTKYRKATSDLKEESQIFAMIINSRLTIKKQGEWRVSVELYKQNLSTITGLTSYQLTGNKPGSTGGIWSTNFIYRMKSSLRVSITLDGRHADNRTARINMRSEFVAEI